MALTEQDFALQMLAQLRALDPSVSGELGTPERKILDTVAQSLTEAQLELNFTEGGLDFDSKIGADLDRFISLFGFARQASTAATGVVKFSRPIPALRDVRIPTGTQLATGPDITASGVVQVARATFETTSDVILSAGETTIQVPVRALISGIQGNVPANTITSFVTTVFGITEVTNEVPTSGGSSPEEDDALKVRFRNTVFRNLSGTEDQYLALAVSTAFTTKANVVGPISRYREYIQVPSVDDASAYDISGDGVQEGGNGVANEFSSALSTIPYSKHVYETVPTFVSNGSQGLDQIFYTQDIDFRLNTANPFRFRGDTYRLNQVGQGNDPNSDDGTQPTVTFLNVFVGEDDAVQAVRPSQVVLFEHSYMSSASRNDWDRNISNCVDLFIDGGNEVPAAAVVPLPTSVHQFNATPTNRYYYENYRRIGYPEHRPVIGNVYMPLFFQPITDLPDILDIGPYTFTKGINYWAVEDISEIRGTVRARNGVEWSTDAKSKGPGDTDGGPFTGPVITAIDPSVAVSVEVNNYTYDRNVPDLQVAIEGSKQVTTDALAHRAVHRYFKLDITVMYTQGIALTDANTAISQAISDYYRSLLFGSTIQLSDLLQVIHNTPGVDNVRWSRDIDPSMNRVTETDAFGNPRTGIIIDRVVSGSISPPINEIQQAYITGAPTGGTFTLTQDDNVTTPLNVNPASADVQSALVAAGISATVTGSGTPASPFRITLGSAPQSLITADISRLTGGTYVFNNDYFLKDNELPANPQATISGDTAAGLIIRARAQNTWTKGG